MTFESVYLLDNTISTPTQADVSETKYPCTGFCYKAVEQIDILVSLYTDKQETTYSDIIRNMIYEAGVRKSSNNAIPQDGEFIDEDTIKNDFPEIFNRTTFKDYPLATEQDMDIFTNQIHEIILTKDIMTCIFVNRSSETILFVKIADDRLLVIDSHQPKHGTVSSDYAVRYITRNEQSKGNIQIGIYDPYI